MIAVLSVLCAFVHAPPMLVILRFLVGVAVGADYPIATSMIAEFSPRKHRAAAMGVIAAAWYLGANVAALVGFALINTAHGWRYMLASSAVPCILILLGRWNIPESPRWLVSKGRTEEAQRIVHETLGANVRLPKVEEAAPTSVRKVLRGVYLRRIVFIGVIWLCQAIPMFALYTYGPQTIGDVLAGIRALWRGFLKGGRAMASFVIESVPARLAGTPTTWMRKNRTSRSIRNSLAPLAPAPCWSGFARRRCTRLKPMARLVSSTRRAWSAGPASPCPGTRSGSVGRF